LLVPSGSVRHLSGLKQSLRVKILPVNLPKVLTFELQPSLHSISEVNTKFKRTSGRACQCQESWGLVLGDDPVLGPRFLQWRWHWCPASWVVVVGDGDEESREDGVDIVIKDP
jgi:hypothetical protein